jgi:hypothetical protein
MKGYRASSKAAARCGCANSKRTCEVMHRHGESNEDHLGMQCDICTTNRQRYQTDFMYEPVIILC